MYKTRLMILAALALPMSIGTVYAAEPVDLNTLPKVECSELSFGRAFLDKYPRAPAACQEARDNKGDRYGKFEGKVYLASPEFITVSLLNVAGDVVTTFSFKPGPNAHVNIGGKDKKFKDLAVGEKLTFWVSEKRMTAEAQPRSTSESWTVLPPK